MADFTTYSRARPQVKTAGQTLSALLVGAHQRVRRAFEIILSETAQWQ
jgi:hypothetical protein